MINTFQGVTQVSEIALTSKSNPTSTGWSISTSTPSGGRQKLTIHSSGAVVMVLDLTTAEAAAIGTALGGTGGAPAASMVGQ